MSEFTDNAFKRRVEPFKNWLHLAAAATAVAILCGFCLVLSEWLFFVTKPSFLLSADIPQHLRILSVTPWIIASPIIAVCLAGSLLVQFFSGRASRYLLALAGAALLTVLLTLMLDNFTYTLFRLRSFDLSGLGRYLYLIGCLLALVYIGTKVSRALENRRFRRVVVVMSLILAITTGIAVLSSKLGAAPEESGSARQQPQDLPNIILFSADGLDVRRLSAFGYERTTSPFLKKILDRGLVFENSFSNSHTSTGSIGALLTGRLPTTTRVNFRPDLFRDEDAYRHLPSILRSIGYYNAEITVRYYLDADDFNLREAFHWANGRLLEKSVPINLPPAVLKAWNFELYFLRRVTERVTDRVQYVLLSKQYSDPYREVMETGSARYDAGRLQQLREVIEKAQEPFFINTHFMVTHGSKFPVYTRKFSANQEQSEEWMTDFYDDALLDVDLYLNFLFDLLRTRGQLDRTLIVYTTDHGERGSPYSSAQRLPLIFFFPNAMPAGRKSFNAQRIDIAPTLLDYLGLTIPSWMEGDSLLAEDLPLNRPIVGTKTPPGTNVGRFFEIPNVVPPFYTLDKVYLIQCQRYWHLNLVDGQFHKLDITDHTDPCEDAALFADSEARQYLLDHLIERHYAPDALKNAATASSAVSISVNSRSVK
jgi:arylsulfatase A-like enzyme